MLERKGRIHVTRMMKNRSVWHIRKYTHFLLMIVGLTFGVVVACGAGPSREDSAATLSPMQTTLSPSATPTSFVALDDDASQWGIFYDGGSATVDLHNTVSPSVDGTALQISLIGGQPYTGAHVYRNLAAVPGTIFDLKLSFFLNSTTPIQALEFTTSKWVSNQRYEFAAQWENIGDGSSQQGNPPTWRIWTGGNWQNIDVRQQLSSDTWHTFHLYGDISGGQVHYIGFSCDSTAATLNQEFAPVPQTAADKVAVAVQLDGNSHEDPYQVSIDGVNLLWE